MARHKALLLLSLCRASSALPEESVHSDVTAAASYSTAAASVPSTDVDECPGIVLDLEGSHAWPGKAGQQNFDLHVIALQSLLEAGAVVTLKFPEKTRAMIEQVMLALLNTLRLR